MVTFGRVVETVVFDQSDRVQRDREVVKKFASHGTPQTLNGAFFGALGSAPISSWIGRKWTLFIFSLVFAVGAVRALLLTAVCRV